MPTTMGNTSNSKRKDDSGQKKKVLTKRELEDEINKARMEIKTLERQIGNLKAEITREKEMYEGKKRVTAQSVKVEKMKLYWYPTYESVRNIWLIKELDAEKDFEFKLVHPDNDPTGDRKYGNPPRAVPTLVGPDIPNVLESGAICMYLADRYGKLIPPVKFRSDYYALVLYCSTTLDPLLDVCTKHWGEGRQTKEMEKETRDRFHSCMEYLSNILPENRGFLCENGFTAVDCFVGFDLYYMELMSNDRDVYKQYSRIKAYLDRIKSREAFKSATAMTGTQSRDSTSTRK